MAQGSFKPIKASMAGFIHRFAMEDKQGLS
jgi:hypothetical protein